MMNNISLKIKKIIKQLNNHNTNMEYQAIKIIKIKQIILIKTLVKNI